jgi:5-methylcytosine-specific restriction endonuclease McrA
MSKTFTLNRSSTLQVQAMKRAWTTESKQYSDNELSRIFFLQSEKFLHSEEWKFLRSEAIKIYGHRCAKCGRQDKRINFDHIKPRRFYPLLALDITNLQPLCKHCNKAKGNGFPKDYRAKLPEYERLDPEQLAHLMSI